MNPVNERLQQLTRRHLFGRAAAGIGAAALGSLLGGEAQAADAMAGLPHFAPKAKRVIYLFQSGGPSQMELFDYKPRLVDKYKTELPESIRMGQRLTGMSACRRPNRLFPSFLRGLSSTNTARMARG